MVTTAVGYVRVSTETQAREGVSLEAQRQRVEAYATAKGLNLTEVFVDDGKSGKTLDRPALCRLLERCRSGGIGHVVVWRLDRLTRRTRHLLNLVEDVFLAHRVELHSVSESLDTSTPHGRFVLTLFGGLAQMEREVVSERTRVAMAYKRKAGLPTSHPPLGFHAAGARERLEAVPEELEVVRRILYQWRKGFSLRAIARRLNEDRVPTKQNGRWHASTVKKVVGRREWYDTRLGAA